MQVEIGTLYDVVVHTGDTFGLRDQLQVSIEGGAFVAVSTTTAANTFTTVTLMGVSDQNSDGFMDIEFQDIGGIDPYWVVNGLEITQAGPMMLQVAGEPGLGSNSLTAAELETIVEAALLRLSAAGEDTSGLADVEVRISDLSGALGLASSRSILIDDDAAGFGWFVDVTPFDDSEFGITVSGSDLQAPEGSAAFGRVDLLTVVMHELGHVLGHGHSEEGLMAAALAAGTRRLPADDAEADHEHHDEALLPDVAFEWEIDSPEIAAADAAEALRQIADEPALPASEFEENETQDALNQAPAVLREEVLAVDNLFAELTQSDFAAKNLWDELQD